MLGFDASKMDEDVPKSCQNYPSSVATNVPNGLPGILLKISSGFTHTDVKQQYNATRIPLYAQVGTYKYKLYKLFLLFDC